MNRRNFLAAGLVGIVPIPKLALDLAPKKRAFKSKADFLLQAELEIERQLRLFVESLGFPAPVWDHYDDQITGRYLQEGRGMVGPFVLRQCRAMPLPTYRLERSNEEIELQRFDSIVNFFVPRFHEAIEREKDYIAGPYYLEVELEHKLFPPHEYDKPSKLICDFNADWLRKNHKSVLLRDKAHFRRVWKAWRSGLDFVNA